MTDHTGYIIDYIIESVSQNPEGEGHSVSDSSEPHMFLQTQRSVNNQAADTSVVLTGNGVKCFEVKREIPCAPESPKEKYPNTGGYMLK